MDRQDDPRYPQYRPEQEPEQGPEELWRPPTGPAGEAAPPLRVPGAPGRGGDGGHGGRSGDGGDRGGDSGDRWRQGAARARAGLRTREPRMPPFPRQSGGAHAAQGSDAPGGGAVRRNEDLDLDELDPLGRARRHAALEAARRAHPNTRRRKALRATAGACALLVLAISAAGTYAYEHLFGEVATESLDSLTDRPAEAKADRFGNVPENILVLGSQTRDGQHGMNLGNSTKLGTDISDTAMLVHISAERKWATVVSIPRDLVVPRPQCEGRLDPTQTVPASADAMFDLAMNLGGPTCAVATVEQMTGIRIDHFAEITFNAFQSLTDAVGGVTVCVPPPGINDPHYSGLVLGPGLHTVSGPESLAFVRDRHGLQNGTDLNRIRMQQMFVSSLFNKLASAGTLSDPITLYKIANAVTSNLTVDTGLDSIDAMVGLAGSVQSLRSHYIQFLTVPYGFDPTNQNRVVPGAGFDRVWADLRQDSPLPGSNAAAAFGTQPDAVTPTPAAQAPTGPDPALAGIQVAVYNATQVPHLALYASENLKALGMAATVGYSTRYAEHESGLPGTEVLYPSGDRAPAAALAGRLGGAVETVESPNVSGLTLVVGPSAPAALIRPPVGAGASGAVAGASGAAGATQDTSGSSGSSGAGGSGAAGSGSGLGSGAGSGAEAGAGAAGTTSADPSASISAESRDGDENICSDLPATVKYGGRP